MGVSEVILLVLGMLLACGAMLVGIRILMNVGLEHDPRMPSVGRVQRVALATVGLVAGSTISLFLLLALLNAKPCGPKGVGAVQHAGGDYSPSR
jgi:hypothetical protein